MARIGLIAVGHKDYVNESALGIVHKAVDNLKDKGIDVVYIDQIAVTSKGARQIAKDVVKQDVEGIILFLDTWMECPVAMSAVREFEHLPFAIWGFPMFMNEGKLDSTGSFVSFAMFKGSLTRMEYRFKSILGMPDDPKTLKDAVVFCNAASASEKLKRTTIGLIGYTSMGIYPGTFDHVMMRKRIGPEIDQLDTYTLINRTEKIEYEECEDVVKYLKSTATINQDVSQKDLLTVAKMYKALKQISHERDYNAVNVKCQYELSKEYGMVACVPLSILAENGVVASCEGDIPNTVSMVMLNYLSQSIVAYADVINIDDEGIVKMSPCGFIPYSLGNPGEQRIRKFMPGVGFSGIQNSFVFKPGRVTMLRLVEDSCDYHLVYITGEGGSTELRQGYMPALDVKIDGSITKMIDNFAGQHYALVYGDLSKEIEELAQILDIDCIRV
ncbi:MAG: hypothetical protein PHP06_08520 [Clostridia bacterium]|nr:hypothetical protein [Clostridia bacterium]